MTVAPYMVIVDMENNNGYRDLILPFAFQDPLLQRAVSVVSALHLSHWRPELLELAAVGRTAVLDRLRKDAMAGDTSKVFSLSTWATLVVLLVGETITGTVEFVYLYGMLDSLMKAKDSRDHGSGTVGAFLVNQSHMCAAFFPESVNIN